MSRALLTGIISISFLLSTLVACTPGENNESVKTEVKKAVDALFEPYIKKDLAMLEEALADDPDLVILGFLSDSRWVGRESYRDYHVPLFSEGNFEFTDLNVTAQIIKLSRAGDTAWFSESFSRKARFGDTVSLVENGRVSGTLENRGGKWVFVQLHFSNPSPGKDDVARIRRTIEETNRSFEAAIREGDADKIVSLFTEDYTFMPEGGPRLQGREAARALWDRNLQSGLKEMSFVSVDVIVSGIYAIETGDYVWTSEDRNGASETGNGKYLVVWKRDSDGIWKLQIDIYNSSPPEQS